MDSNNFSQSNNYPIQDGNPYFFGDEALIKFSTGENGFNKSTYWLVSKKDHTVRPFESHMALDAAFGDNLKEALNNVVIVSQPTIDQENDITDGVLTGFTILGPEYAIKEDGSAKPLHFSNHQLKSRFGKPVDEEAENIAADAIERFLVVLTENEDKTGIPVSFIEQLKEDSKLMAFYVSCLAYGKYTLQDIFLDISKTFDNSK